jgi:hypothetical protein
MVILDSGIVAVYPELGPVLPSKGIVVSARLLTPDNRVGIYAAEMAPLSANGIGIAGTICGKPAIAG